jgi:hypothetical protein
LGFTLFFALSYHVLGGRFESIEQDGLAALGPAFADFFNSFEMSSGEAHNPYIPEDKPIQIALIWCLWLV